MMAFSCRHSWRLSVWAFGALAALLAFSMLSHEAVAQQSPLELLMQKQRPARQNIISVPRAGAARRALPPARVQRAPKRLKRSRAASPASVDAIIRESEPRARPSVASPQTTPSSVLATRLPPIPGLAVVAPLPMVTTPAPTVTPPVETQPGSVAQANLAPNVAARPLSTEPVTVTPAENTPLSGQKRIMIIGDSLGIQIGQGLREAFAEQPDIMIDSRARADTGLVNPQVRNWPVYMAEIAKKPEEKPDLVIMLIGANDNQRLPGPDGSLAEQLSDPWRTAYSTRIDSVVKPLKQARIPVIWVGLPVMKNARLSSAMLSINSLFQERVEREGLTYLDIWDQFSDEAGGYTSTGPDIAGEIQRIRAGDGVHFTKAGSRKLAFFVEQEVRKALTPASRDVDLANLPADVNEQIRQENKPTTPPATLDASLPSPDAELAPAFPNKPASGPILTLTAQPSADALTPVDAQQKLPKAAAEVLIEGHAPYPKPGRGDDFTLPR
jgi:uncharacterized protein